MKISVLTHFLFDNGSAVKTLAATWKLFYLLGPFLFLLSTITFCNIKIMFIFKISFPSPS